MLRTSLAVARPTATKIRTGIRPPFPTTAVGINGVVVWAQKSQHVPCLLYSTASDERTSELRKEQQNGNQDKDESQARDSEKEERGRNWVKYRRMNVDVDPSGQVAPNDPQSQSLKSEPDVFISASPAPKSNQDNLNDNLNDRPTPTSMAVSNLNEIKKQLRDWSERTAIRIRDRADDFTARSKSTFSQVGAHLNKVTGYEEIETLKRQVVEQEAKINATRKAAREAKTSYARAVVQRSNSQREVNELLQRKSLWTDSDVGRFTTLVRQDHLYEQEEQRSKTAVDQTEDAVEREFSQLMRNILARYHEEQIWSDKIRSASTYGSLAALGLNLVVFVLAIVIVEPWKRRRLAQTFEKKIEEMGVEHAETLEKSMEEIRAMMEEQTGRLGMVTRELNPRVEPIADREDREQKRDTLKPPLETEMPSEVKSYTRMITRSRKELEFALVGTGAFVAGVLSCFLLWR